MSWIKQIQQQENSESNKRYSFTSWLSWLFLILSVMLLAYAYYRSEIIFHGNKAFVYQKYYLISLIGIIFWGVVLRLREEARLNIVLVATSFIVGIYIVEVGLTVVGMGQSNYQKEASELGIEYDMRTKYQVIEDLSADGIHAVPAVRPRDVLKMNDSILPLGGVSKKNTVGENENGRRMIYLSDRYGFNNPDFEWDAKEIEWLLIGDSFTEGVAVQPGKDIAGQLRRLTNESALNLGRSGNGPLMELAVLIEYAEAVKPKNVLWIYYMNDLVSVNFHSSDLERDKQSPLLIRYLEDGYSQNLINRQKEIDIILEKFILSEKAKVEEDSKTESSKEKDKKNHLYNFRWIRLHAIRNLLNFDDKADVDYPLFSKILSKAKSEVESWGGKFYFVYLPEYELYRNKVISYRNFSEKDDLIKAVKELNIPVIDLYEEIIINNLDPFALFPFRLPGHYNADGYREIAKAIDTLVDTY